MGMPKNDLEELRARLTRRQAQLADELHGDADRLRAEPYAALAGEARDAADEAVADEISDTRQAELSRDLGELRAVEAALERIRRGTYGTCTSCRRPIEAARLRIDPAAERCAPCQAQHERTHAGTKGAKL